MISYLLKILLTIAVGFIIIMSFYSNWRHLENFNWYLPYIIFNLVIYLWYKFYTLAIDYKEKLKFSIFDIFVLFLVQLWFFSWFFFKISNAQNAFLTLFFSIIWYLLLPLTILIISYSFWEKIINKIEEKSEEKEDIEFRFLMWLWLGLTSFIMLLLIFWVLWFYNLYTVFGILIWFSIFSYKELITNLKNIFTYKFEIKNHNIHSNSLVEKINTNLLSTEFLFLFISMLVSANFISIFRSSPIWWDDMWVYMNYPNILAHSWNFALWQMISWQTLTWIWYMFNSPTQAFFLNNLWAILSILVITISFYWFFKNKKTFINIPLLATSIFLAMPMVIFQQAKDMKLDIWLFAISSITVFATIYIFLKYIWYKCDVDNENIEKKSIFKKIIDYTKKCKIIWNNHLFDNKKYLIYLFVIWILSGFAFSIKATSLLLISWIIWIIAYSKLGFAWFLSYLSIFLWIFTKLKLWDYMWAITYPKENTDFLNSFFIFSLITWLILFLYSINKYSFKNFKRFFLLIWVYLAWIFIILTPYFAKHIIEIKNNNEKISLWKLISWSSKHLNIDYKKILSEEKLDQIKKQKQENLLSNSWTTSNEDLGRYFWYEKWINNYLKLPWNLTMQTNQWWEFTNITFIFLALIPVIFLFLRFRNKYFIAWILFILLLEFLIFYKQEQNIIPNSKIDISQNLKQEFFTKNNNIFKDKFFWDNIYKIKFSKYYKDSEIKKALERQNIKENFNKIKNDLRKNFYIKLAKKIKSWDIKEKTIIDNTVLTKKDNEYANNLSNLYNNYNILKIHNLEEIKKIKAKILNNKELKKEEKTEKLKQIDNLEKIYKKYRTTNEAITDYFGKYTMPIWYSIILLSFLIVLAYLLYSLRKDKESQIFRLTSIFMSFYVFLWTISAFWIIWYWITMFYALLILIWISIFYISYYEDDFDEKTKLIKNFWTLIIFIIIWTYFFNSSYPHAFGNTIKNASWIDFKNRSIPWEDLIFLYSPSRINVLSYLNIDNSKQKEFLEEITKDVKNENLKTNIEKIINNSKNIIDFKNKLEAYEIAIFKKIYIDMINSWFINQNQKFNKVRQILKFKNKFKKDKELFNLLEEIENIKHNFYVNLLYPQDNFKSKENIYRIWTFYKYFIVDNTKRLFEDSLLNSYDTYIKNTDINKTVENLKKLWLKYILFDLNAATIDNDPRHALTKRYEDFLKIVTSDKVKLLETDSVCLKVALENYKKNPDFKKFLELAWGNYDSYTKNNKKIWRNIKKNICANFILQLKKNKQIDSNHYPYLQAIINMDEKNTIKYVRSIIWWIWWSFALLEIK